MQYQILGGDSYPAIEVSLVPGEEIVAEAGAMAWMEGPVQVKTEMRGGLLSGMKRAVLAGESFMQNTYYVEKDSGTVALVAGSPGTVIQHELDGELILERGAYIASTPGVTIDSKFEGLSGLFKEGLFVLRATGQGTMFFSGFGNVRCIDVAGEYVIDNGYAVAWDPSLSYRISKAGRKIRSFLFSDQFVLRFSGHGKLWVQSHSAQALVNFFHPYRPVEKSGD